MVNELSNFFNRVGREGFYGLDAGFDTPDTASDALGTDAAAPDANASIARYLGIGGNGSKDMLAGFGNWVGQTFGRQFQIFGQNPMQQPGMNLAIAAQPVGVSVFVGAPRTNPVHVAGSEHGEMPTQPARSSVNVTANMGAEDEKKAKEAEEAAKADPAKKLEEAVKAEREKAKDGFTDEEWQKIVDSAKQAAERSGGDNPDAEFQRIMKGVPRKDFKEQLDDNGDVVGATAEQKQAKWAREFGDWHAENIGRVESLPERARLVDDTAGAGKAGFKLVSTSDKRIPKNVKAYTVQGDGSDYGLEDRQTIYWAQDPKSGNGGWFEDATRSSVDNQIKALTVKGGGKEIKLGGGSDMLEVAHEGLEEGKTDDIGHTPVYDRFATSGASGETAEAVGKKNSVVYRDAAGKWYVKKGDDFVEMPEQPRLVAGRLYFNDAKVRLDPAHADDVDGYMDALSGAADEMRVRKAAFQDGDSRYMKERVERVEAAFDEVLGEGAKDKIKFEYDAKSNVVNVTCEPNDSRSVLNAMGSGVQTDAGKAKRIKCDNILKNLPAGTEVKLNGKKIQLGNVPASGLVNALKAQNPSEGAAAAGAEGAAAPQAAAAAPADPKNQASAEREFKNYYGDKIKAAEKRLNRQWAAAKTPAQKADAIKKFEVELEHYRYGVNDFTGMSSEYKDEQERELERLDTYVASLKASNSQGSAAASAPAPQPSPPAAAPAVQAQAQAAPTPPVTPTPPPPAAPTAAPAAATASTPPQPQSADDPHKVVIGSDVLIDTTGGKQAALSEAVRDAIAASGKSGVNEVVVRGRVLFRPNVGKDYVRSELEGASKANGGVAIRLEHYDIEGREGSFGVEYGKRQMRYDDVDSLHARAASVLHDAETDLDGHYEQGKFDRCSRLERYLREFGEGFRKYRAAVYDLRSRFGENDPEFKRHLENLKELRGRLDSRVLARLNKDGTTKRPEPAAVIDEAASRLIREAGDLQRNLEATINRLDGADTLYESEIDDLRVVLEAYRAKVTELNSAGTDGAANAAGAHGKKADGFEAGIKRLEARFEMQRRLAAAPQSNDSQRGRSL